MLSQSGTATSWPTACAKRCRAVTSKSHLVSSPTTELPLHKQDTTSGSGASFFSRDRISGLFGEAVALPIMALSVCTLLQRCRLDLGLWTILTEAGAGSALDQELLQFVLPHGRSCQNKHDGPSAQWTAQLHDEVGERYCELRDAKIHVCARDIAQHGGRILGCKKTATLSTLARATNRFRPGM